MEELILSKAKELFFNYGLKSVSMDDLASHAGVSKKTVYQFFSDKKEIVEKIVNEMTREHSRLINECVADTASAVDEVLRQSSESFHVWLSVNPVFFYDLEKFFPAVWEKLEQHKQTVLLPAILLNLERGVAEMVYRSDLDLYFIAELRIHQLTQVLQPVTFTERRMGLGDLTRELTLFYLHAITTQKGKTLLYQHIKDANENFSVN